MFLFSSVSSSFIRVGFLLNFMRYFMSYFRCMHWFIVIYQVCIFVLRQWHEWLSYLRFHFQSIEWPDINRYSFDWSTIVYSCMHKLLTAQSPCHRLCSFLISHFTLTHSLTRLACFSIETHSKLEFCIVFCADKVL